MELTNGYKLPNKNKVNGKYVCIKELKTETVNYVIDLNTGDIISEEQFIYIEWILNNLNLCMSNYFITLAEFRDQRINNILNDE